MSVFVSTTFMPSQSSVVEAVKLLAEKGIFNIELGSIHQPENNLETNLRDINYDSNYLTHNFFPPSKERFILNIASANEYIRKQSLKLVKNNIDFAEKINATIYTIHPGFLIDPIKESSSLKNYDFDFKTKQASILPPRDKCLEIFLNSLNEIAAYVSAKKITIAVETQGSATKKEIVIFSKPEEFDIFLNRNWDGKIGLNVNLGHLNLAASAWNFDKGEFIEKIKSKIIAVEVSHNDGFHDEHKSLEKGSWYIDLLRQEYFRDMPLIFEGRNLPMVEVLNSYKLLTEIENNRKVNEVS